MSIISKIYDSVSEKTMYIAVPIIMGITACSIPKSFILTNGPKDMDYKYKLDNMTNDDISKKLHEKIVKANTDYYSSKSNIDSLIVNNDTTIVPKYNLMPLPLKK